MARKTTTATDQSLKQQGWSDPHESAGSIKVEEGSPVTGVLADWVKWKNPTDPSAKEQRLPILRSPEGIESMVFCGADAIAKLAGVPLGHEVRILLTSEKRQGSNRARSPMRIYEIRSRAPQGE